MAPLGADRFNGRTESERPGDPLRGTQPTGWAEDGSESCHPDGEHAVWRATRRARARHSSPNISQDRSMNWSGLIAAGGPMGAMGRAPYDEGPVTRVDGSAEVGEGLPLLWKRVDLADARRQCHVPIRVGTIAR